MPEIGRRNFPRIELSFVKSIWKVVLFIVCVYCGNLDINQSKECECVMEFILIHFNVLI